MLSNYNDVAVIYVLWNISFIFVYVQLPNKNSNILVHSILSSLPGSPLPRTLYVGVCCHLQTKYLDHSILIFSILNGCLTSTIIWGLRKSHATVPLMYARRRLLFILSNELGPILVGFFYVVSNNNFNFQSHEVTNRPLLI